MTNSVAFLRGKGFQYFLSEVTVRRLVTKSYNFEEVIAKPVVSFSLLLLLLLLLFIQGVDPAKVESVSGNQDPLFLAIL